MLPIFKESKGPGLEFKEAQLQCLCNLFCTHDVLAAVPTRFGKSLIFQSLVFLAEERTKSKSFVLVIVPLQSIIEDQIMELKNQGITAGSIDVSKVDDILDGKYSIVCGSAESYRGGGTPI